MKRTEQREHIFKLIFGADFNEESEQGTQTELYLEQIEGATEKDMQYISQKAQKIIEKIDEIDTLIGAEYEPLSVDVNLSNTCYVLLLRSVTYC